MKSVIFPLTLLIGSISNNAPSNMTPANPETIIRKEENFRALESGVFLSLAIIQNLNEPTGKITCSISILHHTNTKVENIITS